MPGISRRETEEELRREELREEEPRKNKLREATEHEKAGCPGAGRVDVGRLAGCAEPDRVDAYHEEAGRMAARREARGWMTAPREARSRLADCHSEPGMVLLAPGGDWLPGGEGLLLENPACILSATRPEEVPTLLEAAEAEQAQGLYVVFYLSYECGAAFGLAVKEGSRDSASAEDVHAHGPGATDAHISEDPPLAWAACYNPQSVQRLGPEDLVQTARWSRIPSGEGIAMVNHCPALNEYSGGREKR